MSVLSKLGLPPMEVLKMLPTLAKLYLTYFFTGEGSTKRVAILLLSILSWKNLPFSWLTRIHYAFIYHIFYRKPHNLGPRGLFRPVINPTYAAPLEIDHNLHKSNSTYHTDLDVSRVHLLMYLFDGAFHKAARNQKTRLILDPATQKPLTGKIKYALGGVQITFHREIEPLARYEVWSRILAWDRKWVFVLSHFVPRGLGRPNEYLEPDFAKTKTASFVHPNWEKQVYATAVSKVVFKLGRFTVHPAIMLDASGLLPERPGGWLNGAADADAKEALQGAGDPASYPTDEWDWQRVEYTRQRGMEFGQRILGLEELIQDFDGGSGPAIGRWIPC